MSDQTPNGADTGAAIAEDATLTSGTNTAGSPSPQTAVTPTPATPGDQPAEQQTGMDQGNTPDPVPYHRFKEINDELKAIRAAQAKAEKEAETQRVKQLQEQNRFKELYEAEIAAREKAEAERAALELAALKRDAATAAGLPAAFADRLVGSTAEELTADAQKLLAAMPTKSAPNLDAGAGRNGQQGSGMTFEQVKDEAARMGVSEKYLAEFYNVPIPAPDRRK